MIYSNELYNNVTQAKKILEKLVETAVFQKAKNLTLLYSINQAIEDLSFIIEKDENLGTDFIRRWNNIMAWTERYFEGHPVLSLLNLIDNEIIPRV